MFQWFVNHGSTILIFVGGGIATMAAFVSERKATGQRERRRKSFWPLLILIGAVISGTGSLWAGWFKDKVLDYLSGVDSYLVFIPSSSTDKSLSFLVLHQGGDTPVYDVVADLIDTTERQAKSRTILRLEPNSQTISNQMTQEQWTQLWDMMKRTAMTLTLGNVTPGSARIACEVPLPQSDDHEYDFAIWTRNGFFSEQVAVHRTPVSGWIWAWRLEKTLTYLKNAKPRKIAEQVSPGFPTEKL